VTLTPASSVPGLAVSFWPTTGVVSSMVGRTVNVPATTASVGADVCDSGS
jgi:hypothetical protein